MNFTQTVAEVMGIVKRPDKLLDIRREVNSAVNHFSADGQFERDIAEAAPALDATLYAQTLSLTLLPRFRKMWYVKPGGTRIKLRKLSPSDLFDRACNVQNTYYITGDNINLNLKTPAASLDVGYFQYPPLLTDAAGTYWMLDVSPFMVIDRAAAKLFTSIGDDTSARRHEAFAVSAYQAARRDYGLVISEME